MSPLRKNSGAVSRYCFTSTNKIGMNKESRKNTIQRFRAISITEGISLLVLLFIAMPLKYGFDMPGMVKYVGWAHGLLFILYVLMLFPTQRSLNWSFSTTALGFVASLVPFGPFLFDRKLKKDEEQLYKTT